MKLGEDNLMPELLTIDRVEVLDLEGHFAAMSDGLITARRIVTVEGDLAQQIAQRWRQLTPGESARCHTPPFGLRFAFQGKVLLQASLCWVCSNMYLYGEDSRSLYGLDLTTSVARELLDLLESVMQELPD